jgi:molybdopterin-containing oxidoreductase family membrane subunit
MTEVRIAAGVFALGFLLFTMLLRVAVAILLGELRLAPATADGMETGVRPDFVTPPSYPVDAR